MKGKDWGSVGCPIPIYQKTQCRILGSHGQPFGFTSKLTIYVLTMLKRSASLHHKWCLSEGWAAALNRCRVNCITSWWQRQVQRWCIGKIVVIFSPEPLPEMASGMGFWCSISRVQHAAFRCCGRGRRQYRPGRCQLHPDGVKCLRAVSPGPTPVIKAGYGTINVLLLQTQGFWLQADHIFSGKNLQQKSASSF